MSRTTVVMVGGFLGSGKTSLILAAARLLEKRGVRTAVILNDQAGALVDTQLAQVHGLAAEQVTGGCFCCRFHDLGACAERLLAAAPKVIFAEPVGSCTDVAATVLQPLRRFYGERLHVAPFTVLRDPGLAIADEDIEYLYTKQLEEADLVRTTKADVYPGAELSVRTGQGIREWLQEVLAGTTTGGSKLLDIDYARYARAEAALGWLNLESTLESVPCSPAMVAGPLLDGVVGLMNEAGVRIAHCKLIASAATGYVKAALTGNDQEPAVEGDLTASPATRHEVLLNLRALGEPEELRRVVEEAMAAIPGTWMRTSIDCFRPAAPAPTYRS